MKKYIIATVSLFIFFAIFTSVKIFAGGCCFKSFSSTSGTAGSKDAKIQATFIQPKMPFEGVLANEKISIHIMAPKAGQSCKTTTDTTDSQGTIEASCSSTVGGEMSIYFSAPNLDTESNQNIGYVPQKIYFDGDSVTQTTVETNTTTTVETSTNTEQITEVTPVVVQDDTETIELKNKVTALEKKVATQQEEVNSLRSILDRILNYFQGLFN